MQVKRRINQFFGSILRKEKTQLEEEQEETSDNASSSHTKGKQGKSNQSYSQWDLIEHIAGEAVVDDPNQQDIKRALETNAILSDGLVYFTEEALENLNEENSQFPTEGNKKPKSFLKRSGSFLRRSLRRSKKKAKNEENGDYKEHDMESENLSSVVHEINTTLLAVASFREDEIIQSGESSSSSCKRRSQIGLSDNATSFNINFEEANEFFPENVLFQTQQIDDDKWDQQGRKLGLKNGLKRQASKLASKFQRSPGSMRLKSTVSVESFPNTHRRSKSASLSTSMKGIGSPNLEPISNEAVVQKRTGSIRRKLSFKQAKKVMRKGASSFGKSMMHASAVMPIAYESPPTTFYPDSPDYEDEYPQHLVQCYYRTISYQQKDCNSWNDKAPHQRGYTTRPTSFYQHGYCYNG